MKPVLPKIPSTLMFAAVAAVTGFAANPLDFGSNIKTADPSGHVWADGRMYIYASHDEECQEDFWMKDWHAFSSADLIHWTDHGAILSVKDLKWADNYAWAPDAAYKNGKYYFIFPAGTGTKDRVNPGKSTKWMGIGIAESDSPTGPFKDMIGAPLWTKPYANDPCLFVDDDGKAYIYVPPRGDWLVGEMADDMRSVKEFHKMDMGGYQPKMEGPWIFKRKGVYYYTMPENNRTLTYYTGSSPLGPWKYQGVIMEQENESNNHHSIVEFKGQWVLFYHRWLLTPGCDKPQRQVCAEYLHFNEDGTIQKVVRTEAGVGPLPGESADNFTPEPGFAPLFNGRDLTGWCFRAGDKADAAIVDTFDGRAVTPDERYGASDGTLVVHPHAPRKIQKIFTRQEFPGNFVLRLEFRAAVNADSGIYLRGPQLQCRDYPVAGPYKELKQYRPQDWNTIEVVVQDGVARCTCNGEVLEETLKLPATGPIGLEGDRGQMEYRRIRIKELP